MNDGRVSSALASLSLALIVVTLYNMVTGTAAVAFHPLSLLVFAPLMCLIEPEIVRRVSAGGRLVAINFVLVAVACIPVFVLEHDMDMVEGAIAVIIHILFAFLALRLSVNGMDYRHTLRLFDLSLAVFIFCFVYLSLHRQAVALAWPALTATVVAFLCLMYRKRRESGGARMLWMALVCVAVIAVTLAFAVAHGEEAGAVILAIRALFERLVELIVGFFLWLFGLFPHLLPSPEEDFLAIEGEDYARRDLKIGTLNERMVAVIMVSLAALAAAFILFHLLRGLSLQTKRRRRMVEKRGGGRPSVLAALGRAFSDLSGRLSALWLTHRHRRSLGGFYFWLTRRIERHVDESPKAYMERVGGLLAPYGLEGGLKVEGERLERLLYAPDGRDYEVAGLQRKTARCLLRWRVSRLVHHLTSLMRKVQD